RVPDGAWRLRQLATRAASSHTQSAVEWPRVYALDAGALARAKHRIESGDPRIQAAYDRLLREAGAALLVPAASVMDKRRGPPRRHDRRRHHARPRVLLYRRREIRAARGPAVAHLVPRSRHADESAPAIRAGHSRRHAGPRGRDH